MVLHSSLAEATAAAHLQDLLTEARQHRSRPTVAATVRRILRRAHDHDRDNSGANRRYPVPR